MKKIIIFIFTICCSFQNIFAKPISDQNFDNPKENINLISGKDIENLNNLLLKQKYDELYVYLSKNFKKDQRYLSFLKNNANDGHVPLYWLLADYYSLEKEINTIELNKWFNIAKIMTLQDSLTCKDITASKAIVELNKKFPSIEKELNKIKENPYIYSEVLFFMQKIKKRSHPKWACIFGNNYDKLYPNITKNENEWAEVRKNVIKQLEKNNYK